MARKFDTRRADKLLTRVIIISSVIMLIYFLYTLTQEQYVMKSYLDGVASCLTNDEGCIRIWHNYLNDFRNTQFVSAVVGIGLPIIYFLGSRMLNYLFPKSK